MIKRSLVFGAVFVASSAFMVAEASAQDPATRFGQWRMDSDAPPPAINIMTYEPWGDGGMSITVAATNARGQDSEWGYDTMFDGEFRAVWGQDNAETSVEWDDRGHTPESDGVRPSPPREPGFPSGQSASPASTRPATERFASHSRSARPA